MKKSIQRVVLAPGEYSVLHGGVELIISDEVF
jgi:hypothetical protein